MTTKFNPTVAAYMLLLHILGFAAFFLPFRPDLLPVTFAVYMAGGLGTTVGYHRMVTHRAFRSPRWVEYFFVTLAMINTPGSPLLWVANHRQHHAHADQEGDPHSPKKGLWYSHIAWICDDASTIPNQYQQNCKDIAEDPYYHWLLTYRMVPQLLAILVLGLIFGASTLPQIFFLPTIGWMNATFAVNSICHSWGRRPFETRDHSGNLASIGILALGEGWHNNHHAFPSSARIGLRWWQLDIGWWVIRVMQALGLAWDLRLPSQEQLERRAASENLSAQQT